MLTHTGERSHECDVCQKAFTERGRSNGHTYTYRWKITQM